MGRARNDGNFPTRSNSNNSVHRTNNRFGAAISELKNPHYHRRPNNPFRRNGPSGAPSGNRGPLHSNIVIGSSISPWMQYQQPQPHPQPYQQPHPQPYQQPHTQPYQQQYPYAQQYAPQYSEMAYQMEHYRDRSISVPTSNRLHGVQQVLSGPRAVNYRHNPYQNHFAQANPMQQASGRVYGADARGQNANTGARRESECSVCLDKPIDSALYGCGHMSMCYECATQQWNHNSNNRGRCPICRAVIRDVIRIYKS